MSIWLRVAGYPATEIAAHTPPTWETWADGGCGSASWAFALSVTSQHQALRVGTLVEVMCGPMPIWSGLMAEPDRTTWECTAYGLASAGRKNFLALDAGGNSTRDVAEAVARARLRGWAVSDASTVAGTPAGDPDGNPISVAQLLDELADELGQRWGVDSWRRVYMQADPTVPVWLASPETAAFGTTDEDRAGKLFGRYLDSTSNTYATAIAGDGLEMPVDLTSRGAMSLSEAQTVLAGMLTRKHAGPAWTNGVTLSRDQIQTRGGTPAFLPAIRAGQMVRSLGLSSAVQALALDTVIGKTRYTAGEDSIYVEPVNTAPRGVADVIAAG